MFAVACGVGDVLVALAAVAPVATGETVADADTCVLSDGETVADVDTCARSEDSLAVSLVETAPACEAFAVDESAPPPLEEPAVDGSSPLEPVPLESSSPLAALFGTQEFGNKGAFIRSLTSPSHKAWIECSGEPPRQFFFKQHMPASVGLIWQSLAPKFTKLGLGSLSMATFMMFCAKGHPSHSGAERA